MLEIAESGDLVAVPVAWAVAYRLPIKGVGGSSLVCGRVSRRGRERWSSASAGRLGWLRGVGSLCCRFAWRSARVSGLVSAQRATPVLGDGVMQPFGIDG